MLEVQQGAYSLQQRHNNNINTNTTNTNITNNNNNTVAAGIDNKIEKGAVILRNSTTVEINSFFYVHVPKTGTSLYTVLRNRLSSCNVKDFTCFGIWGGGIWGNHAKDGKIHYPFSAKSLGINDTREESCGNTLNCQRKNYHCNYEKSHCRRQQNKVTMFRDPQKWFRSRFEWMWLFEMGGKNIDTNSFDVRRVIRGPPMAFTTGKSNTNETDEAFNILQSEYLWWGITDYWKASVCLFHCELGGEERASETSNSRSDVDNMKKTNTEVEATLPKKYHRSSYVKNYTEYVEETFPAEIVFYHKKVLPEFRRRALVCNCSL